MRAVVHDRYGPPEVLRPVAVEPPVPIGTAAVQLARHFGAEITAVCNSENVEIVRSLGAGQVIDYTKDDFTSNGQVYDVIYDAVGKHSFRRCRGSLKPGGIYLATDGWHNVARSWRLAAGAGSRARPRPAVAAGAARPGTRGRWHRCRGRR
jgi:Zinc-binding dehydrogenase